MPAGSRKIGGGGGAKVWLWALLLASAHRPWSRRDHSPSKLKAMGSTLNDNIQYYRISNIECCVLGGDVVHCHCALGCPQS